MNFAELSLICAVAILGPVLALPRGVHVPVVVGELLVGLALGTTGLGVLDAANPTFSTLAEIGFALVMLVAGTHVPVRDPGMRAGLARGAARAAGVGLLAVPLGLGVAQLFGTGHGPLYAVLIASSSAALVMPVLAGEKIGGRPVSELMMQIAIADAACIVALPAVLAPERAGRAALGTVVVALAAGVVFVLLRHVERSGTRRRVHKISEDRRLAIELRTVLTILFALAALAVYLGVSVMLAGFATGVVIASVGEPKRLSRQVFALTEGFFGPIFFVWLGTSLDLRALAARPEAIGLGLALGLTALLAHASMALTRQPWPLAAAACAQLGVPVAAVTVGSGLGTLAPGEDCAILLGALFTIGVVAAVSGRMAHSARDRGAVGDTARARPGPAARVPPTRRSHGE